MEDSRRYRRFAVAWSVQISASWDDVLNLETENISRGGIFVRSQQAIDVGSRVDVALDLPDDTLLQVTGEVVHVVSAERAEADGLAAGFGIRFDEQHALDLGLLGAMAASHARGRNSYPFDDTSCSMPALLHGRMEGGALEETSVFPLSDERELEKVARLAARLRPGDAAAGDAPPAPAPDVAGAERGSAAAPSAPPPPPAAGIPPAPPAADSGAERAEQAPGGPAADGDDEGPPDIDLLARTNQPAEGHESIDLDLELDEPLAEGGAPAGGAAAPAAAESLEGEAGVPTTAAEPGAADEAVERELVDSGFIFGIDFGTSYTSIALVEKDRVRVLEDAESNTMLPSVVSYPDSGPPIVGWPARERMAVAPSTTFVSPKRLLGRRLDDKNIEPWLASSPVRTSAGPGGQIVADVYGDTIAIPQVCAEVLKRAAQVGEQATGHRVRKVVLATPVAFDEERTALERAARLAGLEVVTVIDEPVAAAMTYGLGRTGDELVAVYDFGGGTFDFTLLQIKDGKLDVVGEAGDPWLGGDDFDLALAEYAANAFWRERKVDLHNRQVEWQRLVFLCEAAKRRLSIEKEAEIVAREIVLTTRGPLDLRVPLDRKQFAELCDELVERSIETMDSCLALIDVKPTEVTQVAMTGGVSRIPLVRQHVQDYFQREIPLAVNPEQAIVLGTAIYGRFIFLKGGVEGLPLQ